MKPHHVREVMFSAEALARRVDTLVDEMQKACRSDNFVMIGILRGSFIFLADLVRDLYQHGVQPRIDFLTLESYGSGTESSGDVRVVKDIRMDVAGADVLVEHRDTGFDTAQIRAIEGERGRITGVF